MSRTMLSSSRLIAAFAFHWISGLLFIVVHLYATYIAYADGFIVAIITFGAVALSDIFWFGVAWHATGTPLSAYGSLFIAALGTAGVGSLLLAGADPATRATPFFKWRIGKALRAVTREFYGGNRDLDTCLSRCRRYGLSVPASLAIVAEVAASKTTIHGPMEPEQLYRAILENEREAADANDNVRAVIELQRARADLEIARANAEFEIESIAPPYSFHGLVSRYERAARRPLTFEERKDLRIRAQEIETLDTELRDRKIAEIVAESLNRHVLERSPPKPKNGDSSFER